MGFKFTRMDHVITPGLDHQRMQVITEVATRSIQPILEDIDGARKVAEPFPLSGGAGCFVHFREQYFHGKVSGALSTK